MGSKKESKEQIHKREDDTVQEENLSHEESAEDEESLSSEGEIEELKAKVAELEDKYLREHADFENIKKRMEKEKAQAVAYANEQFARDLLSVIDSLEQAKSSVESHQEPTSEIFNQLKEGIDLTLNQFEKVFKKHGIELISIDDGFDPNFHDAVMQVESDEHDEGEIVQLLQKGYKIKDRLLRSAMVSVAKAKK